MKSKIIVLLIFIAISCKNTVEHTDSTLLYSQFQATIDSIYSANPKSVGIMVHIESPKNNLSWSGCSGYSNKDQKIKLASDQPALIASTIKPYISASILRLQELGLLTIEDPISKHLTEQTILLFEEDGYDFNKIEIKHLLSHTSGIKDYLGKEYLEWIDKNQKHRWTRNEQLKLTVTKGDPLGDPEDIQNYADANFLLCTEIIESNTKKPFYTALRDLLKYEELGFRNTWFPTLEKSNPSTKSLVHQYWSLREWDFHEMDHSFDLYGGGGIATTTEELAKFSYSLFQGSIIEDTTILNKMFTNINPPNSKEPNYCLGLRKYDIHGFAFYSHSGFWGTNVLYFPELEASIAVYVLDKDKMELMHEVPIVLAKQIARQID